MLCAIWYHLDNLRNVKNTHGRVLLLVAYNFTKGNTPPWVFFHFFKIVQMVPNRATHHIYSMIFKKVLEADHVIVLVTLN